MDQDLQLMKLLTETQGPPGFEERIYRVFQQEMTPYADDVIKDNLGSIVAKVGQQGPKIMMIGHLDEVGFMVSRITDHGFLRLKPLGGWWGHVMLSQRVHVLTSKGDLIGIIGSKPPHALSIEERKEVVKIEHMFVDIGAGSREEAEEMGVQVGDPITTICPFEVMGNPKHLLSRTWDNRAGCYVAIKVLQRLKAEQDALPNQVFAGASVQEEVGLRGAGTLTHKVNPDIGFALDVGVAGDTPGMKEKDSNTKLGDGPLIGFLDRSMIPHRPLRDFVVDIAKSNDIPYQIEIMEGGGTDAGRIHTTLEGVPSLVVSVPSRYIHSHVSVVHRDDLDHAVELLVQVAKQLDATAVEKIKGL
ncbi:M42 family metallopeptidase [Caldalkalibacillus salinus]|uniref:M42 family metallopeptidase n=1 Tax=Caldalkalibacillus salinus TaxID=2803787 RepID=UPI0019206250|nr:M42 family metallopeptidase [Caldalkalibacillus salinus]